MLGLLWALVALLVLMVLLFIALSMAAGVIAGAGSWLLFQWVAGERLFEVFRGEFGILAVAIGIATAFGLLATLVGGKKH